MSRCSNASAKASRPVTPEQFGYGLWATIDPGVHIGIALWDNGVLIQTGSTSISSCDEVSYEVNQAGVYARQKVSTRFEGVLVEGVEVWSGSATSMASAARGDLSKLAYLVGGITFALTALPLPVYIISPKAWKGQLDYKVLRRFLLSEFKVDVPNDHVAAAVGMGYWALGKL